MRCIRHVDALPPVRLDRTVDNVSHLRERPYQFQDVRKRNTRPFGHIRPPFLTLNHRDVAAARKALELHLRERRRAGDHPIDDKAPVGKRSLLKALEFFAQGCDFVCERILGNLASRKLTRQRVARQQPLCRIGQRFAGPVDASGIGRNQPIALGELRGEDEPRCACCYREAGRNQFTARKFTRTRSRGSAARPAIMARMRLRNPARKTIKT